MKQLILSLILFTCTVYNGFAQYHIAFKYEYFSENGDVKQPVEGQDILYQDFYAIDGMSKSIFDCGNQLISTYDSISNQRTIIDMDGQMTTFDGGENKEKDKLLKIEHLDTLANIMGYECKAIRVTYQKFTLTSFYSDEVRVNPSSFSANKYADYDLVTNETNGGLDLKYIYELKSKEKIVANPILIEKMDLTPDDFNPKKVLRKYKAANKTAFESILTGIDNKYNIKKKPVTLEATGSYTQGKLFFPLTIKIKNPNSMVFTMSFGEAKFMMGFNSKERWEYNPMEEKVQVKERDEDAGNNYLGDFSPMLKGNWNSYDVISLKDLDSCYRLIVRGKQSKKMSFYYFEKESLFITRYGDADSKYELSDYQIFEGYPFPARYQEIKITGQGTPFNAHFTEVKFNIDHPDSIFEIPQALRSKVVKKEKEKTPEDYYNEAEAFRKEGKYNEAIEIYKQAITLNGYVPLYHNQLGLTMLKIGDNYGAIAAFSKVLDLDPQYHKAMNNLGYSKMNLGDYRAAITDIDKAIALYDENATYFSNRGLCYYRLENYDSALTDFKRLLSLEPENRYGCWNVGMSYYHLQQYDSAIVYFDSSVEAGYATGELYNYLGICHYNLGSLELALSDFEKATKSDEPLINYFGNLGSIYSELGNSKKAIQAFNKGISLDSTYAEAHNLIGLEFMREGSYGAAIVSFTHAIAINNTEAAYYDNRGKAKSGKMDYIGAIDDFSQSISLYPDDANIYYLRGLAKKNINENFDACRDFKKAAELGLEEAEESMDEFCFSGSGD